MREIRGLIILLTAVINCFAADQLLLANGDRISGKVQINGDAITLASEAFGTLKVSPSAVTKIVMDAPTSVVVGDATLQVTSIAFSNGTASVHVDGGEVRSASAVSIRSISFVAAKTAPAKVSTFQPWSGSFEAGFTTARGNTSINNLHFAVNAVQTTDHHRLKLSFNSLLAESGAAGQAVSRAAIIHSGARYEINVSDKDFAFGLLNFDSDQQQRLDLRSVVGGGIGRRLADATTTTLDIFTGATFNREDFISVPDRISGEFLGGQELTYHFSSRASVSERLVLFPNFTSPGDFRLTFDSSALMKLNTWLGWESRVSEMYITNPANLARNNDVIVTTGIRFTYGNEEPRFKPRSRIAPFTN